MVRKNKLIIFCSNEDGWNEARMHIGNGVQLQDVKAVPALDGGPAGAHCTRACSTTATSTHTSPFARQR
eukprot:6393500-Amphidinium_carterae.2